MRQERENKQNTEDKETRREERSGVKETSSGKRKAKNTAGKPFRHNYNTELGEIKYARKTRKPKEWRRVEGAKKRSKVDKKKHNGFSK